ncbi:MAG: hypothetical protein Crog4KO_36570 [Crocinitomicaceae bacterium]
MDDIFSQLDDIIFFFCMQKVIMLLLFYKYFEEPGVSKLTQSDTDESFENELM